MFEKTAEANKKTENSKFREHRSVTFARIAVGFDSSRMIGRRTSRNRWNKSSFCSPSWMMKSDVTEAANVPSISLPRRKLDKNTSTRSSHLHRSKEHRRLKRRISTDFQPFWHQFREKFLTEESLKSFQSVFTRFETKNVASRYVIWSWKAHRTNFLFRRSSMVLSNWSSRRSETTTDSLAVEYPAEIELMSSDQILRLQILLSVSS